MASEMMPSDFLDVVAKDLNLKPDHFRLLRATGARSPAELYSIFQTFPSLSVQSGLDVAETTDELATIGGEAFSTFLEDAKALSEGGYPQYSLGAAPPPDEPEWTLGAEVALPPQDFREEMVTTAFEEDRLDLRRCLPWPVRDQGRRGTCVSFAVTALREALDCEHHRRVDDLSEQFLYWAIKQTSGEPFPGQDGTLIDFGRRALQTDGICEEVDWVYNPAPMPGNPAQGGAGKPSSAAQSNALTRRHTAGTYQGRFSGSGRSAQVETLLGNGRPIAIAVPVFSDPLVPGGPNNWTTPLGLQFGWIADPQPTSVVSGGHAVCCTGYLVDPDAPGGGWFVVRNSWGASWGRALPAGGRVGPEPGYGQISARYVDRFLWEVLQL